MSCLYYDCVNNSNVHYNTCVKRSRNMFCYTIISAEYLASVLIICAKEQVVARFLLRGRTRVYVTTRVQGTQKFLSVY